MKIFTTVIWFMNNQLLELLQMNVKIDMSIGEDVTISNNVDTQK